MDQILTCLVSLGFLVEKWPFCSTLVDTLTFIHIHFKVIRSQDNTHCLDMNSILWSKGIVQVVLFVIFLIFFGRPSLERYLAQDIMVVQSSQEDEAGVAAPGLTLCPGNTSNNITDGGWRQMRPQPHLLTFTEAQCSGFNGSVEECIEERTYSQEEVVARSHMGSILRHNLSDSWSAGFTNGYSGRCYTLKLHQNMRDNDSVSQTLELFFDTDLTYTLYLHDPMFYTPGFNPTTFPGKIMRFNVEDKSVLLRFVLTKHQKLSTPQRPCSQDTLYNFNACVKESFSREAGCRSKWDQTTNRSLPTCTSIQFRCLPSGSSPSAQDPGEELHAALPAGPSQARGAHQLPAALHLPGVHAGAD